jgi:hypothetical protein
MSACGLPSDECRNIDPGRKKMKAANLNDSALIFLYDVVENALSDDDQKRHPKSYGVRENPDWRTWSDELAAEMDRRKIKYAKIKW